MAKLKRKFPKNYCEEKLKPSSPFANCCKVEVKFGVIFGEVTSEVLELKRIKAFAKLRSCRWI